MDVFIEKFIFSGDSKMDLQGKFPFWADARETPAARQYIKNPALFMGIKILVLYEGYTGKTPGQQDC